MSPLYLDAEYTVAAAARVVHCGAPHRPAQHALVDEPLHAVGRSDHHLLWFARSRSQTTSTSLVCRNHLKLI